jgi:tight adherence protein B
VSARAAALARLGPGTGAGAGRRRSEESIDPLRVAVVLETLAGALRGGAGIGPALAAATRGSVDRFTAGLARVAAELDRGSSLDAALARWVGRDGGRWCSVVADAFRLGAAMGAGLPEAIERIAAGARDEAELAAELRALTAPARASAILMSAMPVAFALVVVLPDPPLRSFLFGTSAGWACVVAGVAADVAGAVWMRSLVRSVA